jgi:hypothetical protein
MVEALPCIDIPRIREPLAPEAMPSAARIAFEHGADIVKTYYWESGRFRGLTSPNKLSTLPEAIDQLSELQALDLSNNQLSTLPEAIGRLSQLQELNLSGNQLSTLPEAIGRLSQLQGLNLSGNQLSTLPEAIGQNSPIFVVISYLMLAQTFIYV